MARSALIAIGGHALIRAGQRGTIEEQKANARASAQRIAQFVSQGWSVILTHGNGPQVGAGLLRSERAADEVYPLPLDVCVASSQSEIGYLLELELEEELRKTGIHVPVMTVLTEVEVDPHDPAFNAPSKPIGPLYSKVAALEKERTVGWRMVEDSSRTYLRAVPSPRPKRILQLEVIRQLHTMGILLIALGGGGIPVIRTGSNGFTGVEAVIDKDRSSAMLASELHLDVLIITTDVDRVCLNFKTRDQRALCRVCASDLRRYCGEGHFPAGSMGPKMEAALAFLGNGGKEVIITTCERLPEAVSGYAGTHIVP